MLDSVRNEYQKLLLNHPERYSKDLDAIYQRLDQEEIYYQGEVIPIAYQPLFFGREELAELKKVTVKLSSILTKVIEHYLHNPQFRSYFNFAPQLEELILADPGYSNPVPMARFDIFYYDRGDYKFCELNTDGSSGMVKSNTLEELFTQAQAINDLAKQESYQFTYCELLDSWIDTMLDNYNEFAPEDDDPTVAIIDFDNLGMVSEFKYFKNLLEVRGYQVVIVDPRELEYRAGKLYYQELVIDLIYRRAVTTDIMDHYFEVQDLLEAYCDQAVCIVGSFRSQIIHNKIIFALLHNKEQTDFLNDEERKFIKQYIPWTALVKGKQEELEYIKANQDTLVLKPLDAYGAQGVYIGCDLPQDKWQSAIEEVGEDRYLVQEFCPLPQIKVPRFSKSDLDFQLFNYTQGLFMYNLEFAGLYTRADKEHIIASSTGCLTLPNLIVD
ncbi:MAG: circularly permuted type 2 ATP-grasp protein [Bacillota bacterium]